MKTLHLLSGGAAQGLVVQLEDAFEAQQQCAIDASFGAVGMMQGNLLAGSPCDVVILTGALVDQLTASGHLIAGSSRALGPSKPASPSRKAHLRPASAPRPS